MSKKYRCVIEVEVPNGSKGWQEVANARMRQAIEKLRLAMEELGGKVYVRY
jgi:GH25 family lysozyme M1 (1,4-beta-N-acetylmuramidase)